MNYFRIPLNLIVVIILLKVSEKKASISIQISSFSSSGFSIKNYFYWLCRLFGNRWCLHEFIKHVMNLENRIFTFSSIFVD